MRVSVIIASHNEGQRLWRTVGSCVETCAELDYEIVIADDASLDDGVEQAQKRFPQVRVVRHETREGPSPTKALGAQNAKGDVYVFLDGHTKPEYGAIPRLVEDVGRLKGESIVVPQVPALDTQRWKNNFTQSGNGYRIDLTAFSCGWLPLEKMRAVEIGRKEFYESPALIGCALAVHRELYDRLWGFDRHMRMWGVEDIDFGLKCWLMGHSILHDPQAVVGHRFRATFDNFPAPPEHIAANQLRMARKNFTQSVWEEWLDRARRQQPDRLFGHPEGLWAHVWQLFEADRESVERERAYLAANRSRDEFWYADRFGLTWPALAAVAKPRPALKVVEGEGSPSPPPPKKCDLSGIDPSSVTLAVNQIQPFTAQGERVGDVQWSTGNHGDPSTGSGAEFPTKFPQAGQHTVTAQCSGAGGPIIKTASVTAVQIEKLEYQDPGAGWQPVPDTLYVAKGTIVTFRAVAAPAGASFPMEQPTWTGANAPVGDVVSATFHTKSDSLADFKVVTAKCGNTKQANVIVFTFAGKFKPQDDFPNRSYDRYGLNERVDLSFTTDPAGVTAGQIGQLQWKRVAGRGAFFPANTPPPTDGTATFDMPVVTATSDLQLTILSGLSSGQQSPVYTKQAVAPDGGDWNKISGVWHCANTYSIAIGGDIFINSPGDVSFWRLYFTEGGCPPDVQNPWFVGEFGAGYSHQAWNKCFSIGKVSVNGGKLMIVNSSFGNTDCAFLWKFKTSAYPGSQESMNWPIPWEYTSNSAARGGKPFTTTDQWFDVGPGGTADVYKGNGEGHNKDSDPFSPLGLPDGRTFTKLPKCPRTNG